MPFVDSLNVSYVYAFNKLCVRPNAFVATEKMLFFPRNNNFLEVKTHTRNNGQICTAY